MGKQGLEKGAKAAEPVSGARDEPDPPSERGGSWGGGTYGSSRLSLLEIQTLSISCKDAQVGQRRNNLPLPCDAHPTVPAPLPMPVIMQGAAKNPKFGHGRKGLAPALGLHDRSLAAGTCCQPGSDRSRPVRQRPPLAWVPTTVCCSCWNLRLTFWAQKKPKEPILSSA